MSIAFAMLLTRYESNTNDLNRESKKLIGLHEDRDEIKARFAMLDLPIGDHYVIYGTQSYNQKVYRITKTVDGVSVSVHEPLSVYGLKFTDDAPEVEPAPADEPTPTAEEGFTELVKEMAEATF